MGLNKQKLMHAQHEVHLDNQNIYRIPEGSRYFNGILTSCISMQHTDIDNSNTLMFERCVASTC